MQQYWWVQRREKSEEGVTYAYLCNASGRETAKRMAQRHLLGDPDDYIVTPLTSPGQATSLRINIESTHNA